MKRQLFLLNEVASIFSTEVRAHESQFSFKELLTCTNAPLQSLPFIPPPRWAAELSRRLREKFPDLIINHHIRFLDSFTHPSFIWNSNGEVINNDCTELTTSQNCEELGGIILKHVASDWVIHTFNNIKREELETVLCLLTNDAALGKLVREVWEMEDLILTDAIASLLLTENVRSARGLIHWISSKQNCNLPDSHVASSARALIGAVALESNLHTAFVFCIQHVLPIVDLLCQSCESSTFLTPNARATHQR